MKRVLALLVVAACTGDASVNAVTRDRCGRARLDAGWVVGLLLSDKPGDREAAGRVYDRVFLQQRVCALFTSPFTVECHDDGCRAATLAGYQLLVP